MKIHGSFINRLGDTVAVEITTRTGGAADMEIGTEEAGLWFDADAPVAIRAEANLYGVINGGNSMPCSISATAARARRTYRSRP